MVNLKKIVFVSFLINSLVLCQAKCQESKNITFDISKGKDSSIVSVEYYDKKKLFSTNDSLYMVYYLNKKYTKQPSAFEKICVYKEGKWYTNFIISNEVVSLMIKIQSKYDKIDNNEGLGYWLPVSSGGAASEGAYATIAYMYSGAVDAEKYNLSRLCCMAPAAGSKTRKALVTLRSPNHQSCPEWVPVLAQKYTFLTQKTK